MTEKEIKTNSQESVTGENKSLHAVIDTLVKERTVGGIQQTSVDSTTIVGCVLPLTQPTHTRLEYLVLSKFFDVIKISAENSEYDSPQRRHVRRIFEPGKIFSFEHTGEDTPDLVEVLTVKALPINSSSPDYSVQRLRIEDTQEEREKAAGLIKEGLRIAQERKKIREAFGENVVVLYERSRQPQEQID